MKRLTLPVMFILFLALAACSSDTLSTAQLEDAVQTLTATVLPPTATSTPDPDESAIVMLLNRGLQETSDPLSQTLDARYQVVDVSFPLGMDMLAATFRVDVRCECSSGTSCCTPERTFIVLAGAMKPIIEKVARQVPASVESLQVACFDHVTQTGMMVASWKDMVSYFSGTINGFQLGSRVVRFAGP